MTRVKGPLMSISASGSIAGGALQFRDTRNGPQVIIPALGKQPRHPNPAPSQAERRRVFAAAAADWRTLPEPAKLWWATRFPGNAYPCNWSAFLAERLTEITTQPDFLTTPQGAILHTPVGQHLSI